MARRSAASRGRSKSRTRENKKNNKHQSKPRSNSRPSVDSTNIGSHCVYYTPYRWSPPVTPPPVYHHHLSEGSQYLRDSILGVNDGLVSIFLLIVGTAAASSDVSTCLLSGLAGALAGAFSMAIGEYLATKSQAEVNQAELLLEQQHLIYHRQSEIDELRHYFTDLGLSGDLLEALVAKIAPSDEKMLKVMKIFQFGLTDSQERNPITAMFCAGRLFLIGSIPSILPFLFVGNASEGLIYSTILVGISLFAVGSYKTQLTHGNAFYSGLENFSLCGASAIVAWFVGSLLENLAGKPIAL